MGNSSKNTNTSKNTIYKNTTTSNPYVVSKTNNKGTKTNFVNGSAYDTINKVVNNNIGNVLNEYLNPSLDSITNKSKLNSYINTVSSNAKSTLENDIISSICSLSFCANANMLGNSGNTSIISSLIIFERFDNPFSFE